MLNIKRKPILLFLLLILLPTFVKAQTCQISNIPASTPTNRFTINDNGTVFDNRTKLLWQRCIIGQTGEKCAGTPTLFTWQQALNAAKNYNLYGGHAGYNDWRLPNIKELASIVETQCVNPSINLEVFPYASYDSSLGRNIGGGVFSTIFLWSSSPSSMIYTTDNITKIWINVFYDGTQTFTNLKDSGFIRLVRG
jgi:hypothetical protein